MEEINLKNLKRIRNFYKSFIICNSVMMMKKKFHSMKKKHYKNLYLNHLNLQRFHLISNKEDSFNLNQFNNFNNRISFKICLKMYKLNKTSINKDLVKVLNNNHIILIQIKLNKVFNHSNNI